MPRRPIRIADKKQEANRGETAYQGLLGILLSGELRPNDVIMERRIAERLGVSRTPLREAIRRLEGERLLSRQSGGTLVVAPITTEDFLNILSIRRLLESDAARRAAARISGEQLKTIREQMLAVQLGGGANEVKRNTLGRKLHQLIADAAANPILSSIIDDLGRRTRIFMRVPERRPQVTEDHLAIIDALIAGDADAAGRAMEIHLDHLKVYILEKYLSANLDSVWPRTA